MRFPKDISGLRFGKLVAVRPSSIFSKRWIFKCDCGNEKLILRGSVVSGRTKSCGCIKKCETISRNKRTAKFGGLTRSGVGKSWSAMILRCYHKRQTSYPFYGGKGIKPCEFIRASPLNLKLIVGDRPEGKTLDRIDGSKGYWCGQCAECVARSSRLNIRWSTRKEQARNVKSNVIVDIGYHIPLMEYADLSGISINTLRDRIKRGTLKRVK